MAMCLINELCYKCGEKVTNDRDDIEVDAIKDAFINNLRQMLGHARSIYCLTKDTLKILPATSSAIKSKHWLFGTSVIHQGSTFLYTHQSYYFSYNR